MGFNQNIFVPNKIQFLDTRTILRPEFGQHKGGKL